MKIKWLFYIKIDMYMYYFYFVIRFLFKFKFFSYELMKELIIEKIGFDEVE